MRSFRYWMLDIGCWINVNNIVLDCGGVVQKFVQIKWVNAATFTHFTHRPLKTFNFKTLYPLLYAQLEQYMHNKFMQNVSVNKPLYTFYTGTITTTTYNI
jgi:hypothetical protein